MSHHSSEKPPIEKLPSNTAVKVIIVALAALVSFPLILAFAWFVSSSNIDDSSSRLQINSPDAESSSGPFVVVSDEEFRIRLQAAQSINDLAEKDSSFSGLARDAAANGNVEVATEALPQIQIRQRNDADIAEIRDVYVALRRGEERFIDTYRRVGIAPFRERVYGDLASRSGDPGPLAACA